MRHVKLVSCAALILLLLTGCAGVTRLPQPQDFPIQSTDDPFFNLYYRVDKRDGKVEAVGLVDAARVEGIATVWVELQEFDANGKVVKKAIGRTYGPSTGGMIIRGQPRPFGVDMRPKDPNDRFEVKVWSYDWAMGDGAARDGGQ